MKVIQKVPPFVLTLAAADRASEDPPQKDA